MKTQIRTVLATFGTAMSLLFIQTPAQATLFGQVSTAATLAPGTSDIGGFVSVFEHGTLLFGQYRQSIFNTADFGIQAGFLDPEVGDLGLALGADLKFMLMRTSQSVPFDFSIDPRVSFFGIYRAKLFSVGGSAVISRDYALEHGRLAPYGALNLRLESTRFDDDFGHEAVLAAGPAEHIPNTDDFEISGIAGVRWDVTDMIDILGEVVFDHEIGFTLGMNFKL